ncbi:hypothetical protein HDU87_003811 [Geranomyces variabilis]|uniref:CsbD-like domain-containing protein n=1 Tax=Geranomyces variabilis TaxID=109894 RepID=A0AAD5TLD3_9FUNG|nr:hypothetical protein HDU87_003811 [Geranomyces variabilis]
MSTQPSKTHGKIEEITGSVRETVGKVTGNQSMRADGAAQSARGTAEIEGVKAANYASGALDSAGGAIKKNLGSAINNQQMQAEGAATQAKGDLKREINQ